MMYESNNHSFQGVLIRLPYTCAGMDEKWNKPNLGLVTKVLFHKISAD